jgi:hypothetical protein
MIQKIAKIAAAVLREHRKQHTRSPHWPAVRRAHLEKHPTCSACGGKRLLQVHHMRPFHLEPALELDPRNLITLCTWKLCHFELGHGDDWTAFNPKVIEHAHTALTLRDQAREGRAYELKDR